MKPVIRTTLSVLAGVAVGSLVNMGLILVSSHVIAPPAGADTTTLEGLRQSMHLFEPRHFLFPFLAHALGTLAGALVATALAPSRAIVPALVVGVVFLAGGIANVAMLPSPVWFDVLDLGGAYGPMAWLGSRLARERQRLSTPRDSRG